jgi:hypothetical protein
MKTANLYEVQSKLTVGFAAALAACAVMIAFQSASNARISTLDTAYVPVQQVVVEGKRMTDDEKLAYDEATLGIARVEIIGKRLTRDEKLAMQNEDQLTAKHRKV